VIARYDGHIAQYLGDGLLVYFGYPVAHEDEVPRAVRAALGILKAMQELNPRLHRPLQVRIGIHTGLVVIGEMGGGEKRELLALGEAPNIAARVQGIAAPDEVVMTAGTARLTQGLFISRTLGLQNLKGISAPMTLYQVLGESGVQNRFAAAHTTGLTLLVGREEESTRLWQRWEQVKAGTGQVVLLSAQS
jgi:class 3 adenylate cyclase